jgi:AraC-like DNA-binding protein
MLTQIDVVVRLVACGASLLLLVLLLTGDVRRGLKLPLAGLLIGSIGYLINSSSLIVNGTPARPWTDLASIFTPFFTWLFALRLFEREPPQAVVWGIAAVLGVTWLTAYFVLPHNHVTFYVIHVIGLALVADLFRGATAGRADDLVEQRRTLRLWLPLLVAAQAGGILVFELVTGRGTGNHDPRIQLINALLILALTLFAGKALLRTEPELLLRTEATPSPEPEAPLLSPSEMVLREKLDGAMAAGFYRTPGLTIAGLAEHLGTPEHRLRALINQRLGYRNFSAFLNRYRIDEAKAALADRARVDLPVLTIAMDLGYNSLPPFNRAFRTETGTTPSEFRRQCFGEIAGQN